MGSATKKKSTRFFELIFICPPTLDDAGVQGVIDEVQGHLTANGAEIRRTEKWGKRKLAYPVKKHSDGHYVLLHLEGAGDAIAETERRMRIMESVIKYQTVRLDDEAGAMEHAEERIKRREKMEEERAARAAEKAAREAAREAARQEAEAAKEAEPGPADATTDEPDSEDSETKAGEEVSS